MVAVSGFGGPPIGVAADARSQGWLSGLGHAPRRWLLMTQDRVEGDEVALTHEEIATIRGGSWYTARNIVRELLGTFGVWSCGELVRVAIARHCGFAASETA